MKPLPAWHLYDVEQVPPLDLPSLDLGRAAQNDTTVKISVAVVATTCNPTKAEEPRSCLTETPLTGETR